MYIDKDIK